jgi:molecular chaperone HscB
MPADFLMLQMEWRETIDDAISNKDVNALDCLLTEIKQNTKQLATQLQQCFDDKAYALASELVRKLSFIDKITIDIHRTIETLEN